VHVPFCSSICPYCDFAVTKGADSRGAAFVEGIERELQLVQEPESAVFDSIYLGGGTPSALGSDLLERLLSAVRTRFRFNDDTRVFLEANPEDVDRAAIRTWRRLEVHTVSLGVQSFHDETLGFLGRRHDAAAARRAVTLANDGGFGCVSLDLIIGIPSSVPSALSGLEESLDEAVALGPQHVSCYQLTLHPGTPFGRARAKGNLRELDEAGQHVAFSLLQRRLMEAGFEPYEVSSFAVAADYRSRHNRKYWAHHPYLGLGPSAHSFWGARRWWNEPELDVYLTLVEASRRPVVGEEDLSRSALALEHLMLGLRTTDGVDLLDFQRSFGVDLLDLNRDRISRLQREGRLRVEAGRLRPTPDGLAVADGIVAALDLGAIS
jgi:oxygen-independent coproporphyrinogen-3 oxidase